MKRIIRIISCLLCLLAVLLSSACSALPFLPAGGVRGFYAQGQVVTGGKQDAQASSLTHVQVQLDGEELSLTFHFADAQGMQSAVPVYQATLLSDPTALMLSLPKMDCPFTQTFQTVSPCLGYILDASRETETRLYFQFAGGRCFVASIKDNELCIRIRPDDAEKEEAFYIAVRSEEDRYQIAEKTHTDLKPTDAVSEAASEAAAETAGKTEMKPDEKSGTETAEEPKAEPTEKPKTENAEKIVSMDWDAFLFRPVLCADAGHTLLLSEPFSTMEEADAALLQVRTALENAGDDRVPQTFRLVRGKVPVYQELLSRNKLDELGRLENEKDSVEPVLWATDARFLQWNADSETALMARQILIEDPANSVTQKYEQLYLYTQAEAPRLLADLELGTIAKAAFSPDGTKVAFIEVAQDFRLLYLYDLQKNELTYLAGEGLGEYTADFVWNTDGRLFCMAGDEQMQLMVFDPHLDAENPDRIQAVEEREGCLGSIFLCGGKVYLNGDDDIIYVVDPLTHDRSSYADGAILSITKDEQYMAILRPCTTGCGRELVIRSVQTNESVVLSDDLPVMNACFMADQKTLCYLVSNDGQDKDACPALLRTAKVGKKGYKSAGRLGSNSIFAGKEVEELILVASYPARSDAYAPVTFRLTLPKTETVKP